MFYLIELDNAHKYKSSTDGVSILGDDDSGVDIATYEFKVSNWSTDLQVLSISEPHPRDNSAIPLLSLRRDYQKKSWVDYFLDA